MDRQDELSQRVNVGCPIPAGLLWCFVLVGGANFAQWGHCYELLSVLRNVHDV